MCRFECFFFNCGPVNQIDLLDEGWGYVELEMEVEIEIKNPV